MYTKSEVQVAPLCVCVGFLDSLIIFTVMFISFMTSYCRAFVLVRGK